MREVKLETVITYREKGKLIAVETTEERRQVRHSTKEFGVEDSLKLANGDDYEIPINKDILKQVNHEENQS